MVRVSLRILSALAAAAPVFAGDVAMLVNGHEIRADRHERQGSLVRFYTGNGVVELPSSLIASIETLAPAAPAGPVAPVAQVAPSPAPPASPRELIDEAAERYGLPSAFLHGVARTESAYRQSAVSPKGAIGVMQLMPATAAALDANPHDAAENIDAGARHLRDLLVRYEGSTFKALAAYNAGEPAVQKYNGIPPYRETRLYVEKVLRNYLRLNGSAPTAASR
jgi:soluble lytic murein transglycosylase-like protein